MILKTKNAAVGAIIVVIAFVVMAISAVRHFSTPLAVQAEVRPQGKREPGIVKFDTGAPQLSSLKVETVDEVALPAAEPVNGRIAYDENRTARMSSPVQGRVVALHAEIGDRVRRGEVLMDIDSPDLAAADADWRKAQADETYKKLAFERARRLLENDVIARKDYESAQADYRQAAAETKRAALRMKNLNATGNENGKFGLKTPIAGVVADKQVNPGLEVRPDLPNPLYVITDIDHLWVIADVPEHSIGNIKPGQAVEIETDAYPNRRFAATVDRVGLALDPGTRRVQVRCTLDNPDRKLKPEMFARVFFLGDGDRKGVQVPDTALIVDGIYSYVFVERQAGVFEKRRVNVVLRGADRSFIDKGVMRGERVVTEGALLLNSEVAADAQ